MYGSASGPEKLGDCSILIPNSIADVLHAETKWISSPSIASRSWTFQLPGHTMNEWILMTTKDVPGPFWLSPCYCRSGGGEQEARGGVLLDPLGARNPFSIFRTFAAKFRTRYQSHFEALGLHLFVRDAGHCSDDCANSSNPTYSRRQHTHTHRHMHTHQASASFACVCVPGISVFGTGVCTASSWLRKQSQHCRRLRVKNTKKCAAVWARATQVCVG